MDVFTNVLLGVLVGAMLVITLAFSGFLFMTLGMLLWDPKLRGTLLFAAFIFSFISWSLSGFPDVSMTTVFVWTGLFLAHSNISTEQKN